MGRLFFLQLVPHIGECVRTFNSRQRRFTVRRTGMVTFSERQTSMKQFSKRAGQREFSCYNQKRCLKGGIQYIVSIFKIIRIKYHMWRIKR